MNTKWLNDLQKFPPVSKVLSYLKQANAFPENHKNLANLPYEVWQHRFLRARLNLAFGLICCGYFIGIFLDLLRRLYNQNPALDRYILLDLCSFTSLLIFLALLQTSWGRRHLGIIFLGFSWSLEMNEQVIETCMAMFNPTLSEFIQPERLAWASTFFSQAILIPVYWPLHVLSQCLTLGYYFTVNGLLQFDTLPDIKDPISWILTLIWVCFICDLSVYLYERLQRTEFKSRQQLEMAYQELENAEQDIRKALEKEKELSQLKTRLVSMISHEFRTPLTTILGSTEALEYYSHKWSPEKKEIYFRRIYTTIQHLTNLLEDVLILGKAEAQKMSFKPTSINLEEFCQSLLDEMQLQAGEKYHLQLVIDRQDAQAKQANMDEKLLRYIFGNLISNAIKYSPNGGTIQLRIQYNHDRAIFQLKDEGIGIAIKDIKHLFYSFYRAQNVGTIPGTGLGLAIVKRAVEAHQGSIQVKSQLGEGTMFTVTLPLNCSNRDPEQFYRENIQ